MDKKEMIESYFGKVRTLKEGMMEKLIELLNEYTRHSYVKFEDGMFKEKYCGEPGDSEDEVYVISKEFGFIERLVYNNKIDTSKITDFKAETSDRVLYADANNASLVDSLLMLLSISSSPIDDLISYLK